MQEMKQSQTHELLESLRPFLSASPRVHHLLTIESPPHYCSDSGLADLIIVKTPPSSSLREDSEAIVKQLHDKCTSITGRRFCDWQQQQCGDLYHSLIGAVEDKQVYTICWVLYWTELKRMTSFKDPTQPSVASRERTLDPYWWGREVLEPLDDLLTRGADVAMKTVTFSPEPYKWPFQPQAEDESREGKGHLEEELESETKECRLKSRVRSCNIL